MLLCRRRHSKPLEISGFTFSKIDETLIPNRYIYKCDNLYKKHQANCEKQLIQETRLNTEQSEFDTSDITAVNIDEMVLLSAQTKPEKQLRMTIETKSTIVSESAKTPEMDDSLEISSAQQTKMPTTIEKSNVVPETKLPSQTRTLFIHNLDGSISEHQLRELFKRFGQILKIKIINKTNMNTCAFCEYTDILSVSKAMREMNNKFVGKNRVHLNFGKPQPSRYLWINNILNDMEDQQLYVNFSQFGPVESVKIDRQRGIALVLFQQMLDAQSAISTTRNVLLFGRTVQIDFASQDCVNDFFKRIELKIEEKVGDAVAVTKRMIIIDGSNVALA